MYRLGKLSDYTLPYFWLLPALISFCSGMVSRILGGSAGTLTTFALYGLLILGITDGYNKRFLGLARFDLFLIFFVAISIIGTYALFPQNGIYLTRSLSNWPFALLFFIVGKSLVNINMDHVHYASAIGILLMFFGYFVFKSQTNKDMSFAYSALPYVVGLCHGFFFSKKLWLKAFMPIGIALLFLLGTRGPLVIGAAYFIFCFLAKKNTIRRFILCLGGFALLISFINSDQYMLFLNQANDYLMNYGIESYI